LIRFAFFCCLTFIVSIGENDNSVYSDCEKCKIEANQASEYLRLKLVPLPTDRIVQVLDLTNVDLQYFNFCDPNKAKSIETHKHFYADAEIFEKCEREYQYQSIHLERVRLLNDCPIELDEVNIDIDLFNKWVIT